MFCTSTEPNPGMWLQLGEELWSLSEMLFEAMYNLKAEITSVRVDNECLMRDQERIIRSLDERKNQMAWAQNPDNGNR